MTSTNISTLRLFNAVYTDSNKPSATNPAFIKSGLENGFVFDSSIKMTSGLMSEIIALVGINGQKLNSAFHKSWKKIATASLHQLYLEQLVHYITTYGFESMGIYDEKFIYFPQEALSAPEINASEAPFIFIKAMSKGELFNAIMKLDSSGMALSTETVSDILNVIEGLDFRSSFGVGYARSLKNNELKSALYSLYNIAPEEPVEWLRYVIKQLTGETLLIKNAKLYSMLSKADSNKLDNLLGTAPKDLASIFLRYKNLFLAMKKASNNKTFFNQLRKDAVYQHRPMGGDYLNQVTAQIKDYSLNLKDLRKALTVYPIWRQIRLAYAIRNMFINQSGYNVIRVRNGKTFVTETAMPLEKQLVLAEKAFGLVYNSILENLSNKVNGITFYIPERVHYALPSTQKSFIGNVPMGSYVSLGDGENLLVGIHWRNHMGRTDLDFSGMSADGKLGWNGMYRAGRLGGNQMCMFSGDMTDATNGASEFLWYKGELPPTTLFINVFTGQESVPYQLIVGYDNPSSFERNYMIDPNKVVVNQPMTTEGRETNVGLLARVDDENRLYFLNLITGQRATSREGKWTGIMRDVAMDVMTHPMDLSDFLLEAGANIIHDKSEAEEYVDLSPEALDKTTFINMFA